MDNEETKLDDHLKKSIGETGESTNILIEKDVGLTRVNTSGTNSSFQFNTPKHQVQQKSVLGNQKSRGNISVSSIKEFGTSD
jgi:hypothetical protein